MLTRQPHINFVSLETLHSNGAEGRETGDNSLPQCFGGQFSVTVVSSAPKALWVVVMYNMNNHTYKVIEPDN